jgi:hypothetical protein
VEKAYRVSTDRKERAIAGLSMGGTQSLFLGLNTPDRFAWIGAFSSGGMDPNFEKAYPAVNESLNSQLRLLWIACGQHDGLLSSNQKLVDWLKGRKVNPTWVTVPGGHSFMVWRRFLGEFAGLLFRTPPGTDSKAVPYFPSGKLGKLDSLLSRWYSKQLKGMGEPSLSDPNGTGEFAYRFLWLRSFHHPISVRIQKNGVSAVLHAVEFDGAGGYSPGRLAKETNRELSPSELETVMAKLEKAGFWQLKTEVDDRGFDGAEWIMEGHQGANYHIVTRWSPESGDFRELCLYFLQLSGLLPQDRAY